MYDPTPLIVKLIADVAIAYCMLSIVAVSLRAHRHRRDLKSARRVANSMQRRAVQTSCLRLVGPVPFDQDEVA